MQFTIVQSTADFPVKSVAFQPPGGTIGRSQDNDLVLPDETRAISRLQALVHLSHDGECRLTNQGSVTPVEHNGIALGRGMQVLLKRGDALRIGDYALEVRDPACNDTAQTIPWRCLLATAPSLQTRWAFTNIMKLRIGCWSTILLLYATSATTMRVWPSIRRPVSRRKRS